MLEVLMQMAQVVGEVVELVLSIVLSFFVYDTCKLVYKDWRRALKKNSK